MTASSMGSSVASGIFGRPWTPPPVGSDAWALMHRLLMITCRYCHHIHEGTTSARCQLEHEDLAARQSPGYDIRNSEF